jgi:hypothetical protein
MRIIDKRKSVQIRVLLVVFALLSVFYMFNLADNNVFLALIST